MRRAYIERLEPLGLTPSRERALRAIAHADQPLRMVQLAERLGVVPRSVTPVVDALEGAGLVTRAVDPANRRSTLVRLTEVGRERLAAIREARREASDELFAVLSAEQRAELRDLLLAVDAGRPPGGR
jgi:DNA-binding MarR family transcriptional regulator